MSEKKPTILMSALDNYGGYPFSELFDHCIGTYGEKDVDTVAALTDRLALIIWGGANISPSIYNQKPNKYTGAGEELSLRDSLEVQMAKRAIALGIPIIGICRGAQLVCALAGGSLIQHVNNHAGGYHEIVTDGDETYNCPSLHHQMMYPWEVEHKMIAWCDKPRSDIYLGEPVMDGEKVVGARKLTLPGPEPEIVWFPAIKALGIQSHPEFIHKSDHPFVRYCLSLTKQYIMNEDTDGGKSADESRPS